MNGHDIALLAAAGGVGFGHAILPDHWLPLAVLGRTQRYPLSRVARLSGLAGVTHVLVSILLGALIIAVGLQFRSTVEHAQDAIIGSILIATGIGFTILELTGRSHGHSHGVGGHHHHHDAHTHEHHGDERHDHEHHTDERHDHEHNSDERHDHDHAPSRFRGLAAVVVPFGAAASPDLTILPVFLAATTVGVATAIGSVVIFAAVTIGTIVGLTLAAARGGYEIRGQWLERWGNVFTAVVLVVIGALVATAII
jgi:ABC-type nickel/cobalt efflux system permease component RcnA